MTVTVTEPTIETFRTEFLAWVDNNGGVLSAARHPDRTLDTEMAYNRHLYGRLWDEGFSRWGWPEAAGGRKGSALLRTVVAEELTAAGLAHQNAFTMPEILGVPFAALASDELVATFLPRYLSGQDWWGQGFSEPNAGSDLASLSTRADQHGDTFVVNGQKVWTTLGQYAQRAIVMVRTGPKDSGNKGITALFVDMDSPGVQVSPLRGMNGDDEFSEMFFSDVEVPSDRVIGDVDKGWDVAMQILARERATIFWTRATWLHERLQRLIAVRPDGVSSDALIGEAYQLMSSLRARSARTQVAMVTGRFNAPESSIDKALMAASEQALFDAALELLGADITLSDDVSGSEWRNQYLYSRAASIYGGTAEIQRNIIAERVLGLPREPRA